MSDYQYKSLRDQMDDLSPSIIAEMDAFKGENDLHMKAMDKIERGMQEQVAKANEHLNDVILRVVWKRDNEALWDLDDLKERMVHFSVAGEQFGTEHVFFDKEPMLTLYPWETHKDGKKLIMSRPYTIHPVVEKEDQRNEV